MTAPTVPSPSPVAPPAPRAEPAPRPTPERLLAAAVAAVPGGAARPGQQAMSAAIGAAIDSGEHLLVQAGTGTGKSLAYLAPALLVDGPVVVSTATLALQSQLIEHDLPRLAEAVEPVLGRRPTFAVLKGRHHYLCLARLEQSTGEEPADTLFDAPAPAPGGTPAGGTPAGGTRWLGEAGRLGRQIQRLRDWAMESDTGDRDELDPGVDDQVWRLVSMPARECVGAARCPYGEECFADASRARAREVDIVVTNHSLLAVDVLSGRQIVPPHRLLVVDEAHELADRVSSASQAELSGEQIERAARRIRAHLPAPAYEALVEAGDTLAHALALAAPGRLTTGLPEPLRQACTLLDAATRAALGAIGEVTAQDPDPVRKQQAKAVLSELATTVQRLLGEDAQDVAWVEADDWATGRAGRAPRRALVVAPLSVAGLLTTKLYQDRTVVATSATLALGGRFDTMARALGLPPQDGPGGEHRGAADRGAEHRAVQDGVGDRGSAGRGTEDRGTETGARTTGAGRPATRLPATGRPGRPGGRWMSARRSTTPGRASSTWPRTCPARPHPACPSRPPGSWSGW